MLKPTEEWCKVCDLLPFIGVLTRKQEKYVKSLYDNLDPYAPFLSQQSAKQLKWLTWIHDKFHNQITPDW
jgi:hypothetical protein